MPTPYRSRQSPLAGPRRRVRIVGGSSRRGGLLAFVAVLIGCGVLAASALGGSGGSSVPATSPDATMYITNGSVSALVRSGNTLYLGGSFSTVGPRLGPLVGLDPSTGGDSPAFPKVNVGGNIDAVASDGAGGEYVGGTFDSIGGVSLRNAAHVLADGTVDTNWEPNPSSTVDAIAVSGATVYLGGYFSGPTAINGSVTRNYAAAVDATTGTATGWDPNLNGEVLALAVSGGTVYLGGGFTEANGATARNYAAAVDATSGTVTSFDPDLNSPVQTLAVSGGTVYLGGGFTMINGSTTRDYLAAVDATSGTDTGWSPNVNGGSVMSLAVNGGAVYIGGDFTSVENSSGTGSVTRNHAAAVDTTHGYDTGWNPNLNGNVYALLLDGGTVYLGGDFHGAGAANGTLTRNYAAAVDATNGTATSWNPDLDGDVYALAAAGGSIVAGGTFNSAGVQERSNAAAIDVGSGAVTAWNPDVSGSVNALAVGDGTVYLGGAFSGANAVNGSATRDYAAAVDAGTGAVTPWNPNANGTVDALALDDSTVYLGGSLTSIENSSGTGSVSRNHAAAVDATEGHDTGWNPNASGAVDAIAVSGDTVYLGGDFFGANAINGSATRNYAAAVDAGTGAVNAWNPSPSGRVSALAVSGDTVYLGGGFTSIENSSGTGSVARNYVGAVDATEGYDTGWNPNADGSVSALAVSGDVVYLGGDFTSVGGTSLNALAAVDATSGAVTTWDPSLDADSIDALLAAPDGTIYAGGSMTGGLASFSVAPANTVAPQISGAAIVGQTLTCQTGTWVGSTPQTYAYQWLRGGVPIGGATNAAYATTNTDLAQALTCKVTASNLGATTAAAVSAAVTVAAAPTSTTTSTTSTSLGTPGPRRPQSARPNPTSEFSPPHAPYVNTTTGSITVVERLHDPGDLSSRAAYSSVPKWVLYGSARLAVPDGGTATFLISPGAAARAALRAARRHNAGIRVGVLVTFQSAYGGRPVSHTQTLTVVLHYH